jgi:protein-S-isoprenylcysteine O-methyltransferase Ste14
MDGGLVRPFRTTRENTALKRSTPVDLKIVEVVVLLVAGVLFVTWQFRDLRRAKEVTRQQREAEKYQAKQQSANPDEAPSMTSRQSELR